MIFSHIVTIEQNGSDKKLQDVKEFFSLRACFNDFINLAAAFRLRVIISKEEGLPRLSPALSDVVFVAEGDIVVGNKGDELLGSFNQDFIVPNTLEENS